MPKCSYCKQELLDSDFYKDSSKVNGLDNRCKKCSRKYHKRYYLTHKEQLKEKRKEYIKDYRLSHREQHRQHVKKYYLSHRKQIIENRKQYHSKNKEEFKEYNREYRSNNPEKVKTHNLVNQHPEKVKPKIECEACGSTKNLEYHHFDYNKPLDVYVLCRSCHKSIHVTLNRIESS